MRTIKYEFVVNQYFLPYFFSADTSGMTEDEISMVQEWEHEQISEIDGFMHWSLEDGDYFARCEIANAKGMCQTLVAVAKSNEFPRWCSITGEGFDEGFCVCDGELYIKNEADAKSYVMSAGYADLEEAYADDFIYYSDWETIDAYDWDTEPMPFKQLTR